MQKVAFVGSCHLHFPVGGRWKVICYQYELLLLVNAAGIKTNGWPKKISKCTRNKDKRSPPLFSENDEKIKGEKQNERKKRTGSQADTWPLDLYNIVLCQPKVQHFQLSQTHGFLRVSCLKAVRNQTRKGGSTAAPNLALFQGPLEKSLVA